MASISRPTRSRVSSPFVSSTRNTTAESSNKSADERPKTFLDRWIEPPLPAPRPSFAEAGIERHGVVQNMAPLGTRPSQKILKTMQAKPDGHDGVGRPSNSKRYPASSASTPGESVVTPEPTTNSQRRRSLSTNKTEEIVSTPTPKTPTIQASPKKSVSVSRPSVPPPQSSGQGVFALQPSPIPINRPSSPVVHPPPTSVQKAPQLPIMNQDGVPELAPPNTELCDKVVEVAVQEALDRYRYPTAYALRTLYDDHRTNLRIVRLIESIYTETATQEQKVEFNSIMKHKKREGKKNRTGEYYFNGDGSDPAPMRSIFSAISAVNPPPPAQYNSPYATPLPPRPGSGAVSETQARSSSLNPQSSAPASASASSHQEADHAHISKKHKSNDYQPDNTEVNGDASAVNPTIDNSNNSNNSNNGNNSNNSNNGHNGDIVETMQNSPENGDRQRRARSISSSSSLSSVNEQVIEGAFSSAKNSPAVKTSSNHFNSISGLPLNIIGTGNAPFGNPVPQPRFVSPYTNANTFSAVAETLARNPQPPQPITIPQKTGPRIHTFAVTPTMSFAATHSHSSSANTNTHANNNQPSTNSSMAPAVLPPSSSNSASAPEYKFTSTFKFRKSNKANYVEPEEEDVEKYSLKRKARDKAKKFPKAKESFVRHKVSIPASPDTDSESDGPDSIAVVNPSKHPRPKIRLLNNGARETRQGSSRSKNYDSEENALSSPTALGFHPHLAPGSTPSSRAATPNAQSRPTRKGKTGTGLRVKSSPMKKKGGTSAGIPRSGERIENPTGNGVSSTQNAVDNDDFCAACGGNGDLVCCDGHDCTRSFHFKCVDPPLIDDLPDEWFCNECNAPSRPVEDYQGLFGQLFYQLDSKCPRAFSLPGPIRDYFENVKTGTEGEYEEVQQPKPKTTKGWEEAPDYFRLKDSKGNAILCHICNHHAEVPARSIIPCTYCGLYWHMDCLPIPMAREPGAGRQWRCPAHVDDLLSSTLGPAHKFRKIKGAPAIKPAFTRGMRNNGHIEIEYEPSEDEQEQGFFEQKEYGHVYKLPEMGIKLDFINKVKRSGGGFRPDLPTPRSRSSKTWNQRTLDEQQAALNLASMIPRASCSDTTTTLIQALIAEAPLSVVSLIAQGDSKTVLRSKISKQEKQSLRAAMELIMTRLKEAEDSPENTPAPSEEGAVPAFSKAKNLTASANNSAIIINDDKDSEADIEMLT